MNKKLLIIVVLVIIVLVFVGGVAYLYTGDQSSTSTNDSTQNEASIVQTALAAKFDYLSQNGNSSRFASFSDFVKQTRKNKQ